MSTVTPRDQTPAAAGEDATRRPATRVAAPSPPVPTPWQRYAALLWPPLVTLLLLLAAWQVAAVFLNWPPYLMPGPLHVKQAVLDDPSVRADLATALVSTFKDALVGLVLSLIAGSLFGMCLAQIKLLYRGLYPYAVVLQTIPIVTIAPIMINALGVGDTAIILIAFIVALFPIISNVTLGLTSVDYTMVDLFRMYNASPWQQLTRLRIPFALPYLFAGLRISSGLAVIGTVIGETFAGSGGPDGGLGYIITVANQRSLVDQLIAAALLSALLGIAVFLGVAALSHWTLRHWHESSARQEN